VHRPEEVTDSPTDWVARHIRQYVESDGEQGHEYQGWPTLLLTTRGRKTGKLHRTALIYGKDRERYLVTASNAAASVHPHWYQNLVAHPDVAVQVKGEKFMARARTATREERPRLWEIVTSIFPLYEEYQQKSEREIPVVILERV
jgi:deazaflavin-dependent oxidoreductase (nitroreductase family)